MHSLLWAYIFCVPCCHSFGWFEHWDGSFCQGSSAYMLASLSLGNPLRGLRVLQVSDIPSSGAVVRCLATSVRGITVTEDYRAPLGALAILHQAGCVRLGLERQVGHPI